MTVNDYTPFIEKIRTRIGLWTARHLSFAGRLQHISLVIQSLTNFWISAFRLPNACLKEIDKLCSAFLWSGPDLNAKKAKVTWHDVCKPEEEGGLGIQNLKEANKVTCLKLIWRILSANSLWVQWVHIHLIRKASFWSINEKTTLGSWMWKKLLKYRSIAAGFVKIEIKNGQGSLFWYDVWSPMGRLIEEIGIRGSIDLGISLHTTFAKVVLTHRRRRHRSEILNQGEDVIEEVRQRGLSSDDDIVLWRGKRNTFKPCFVSKETWLATRPQQQSKPWCKGIWFSQATPKYSLLAWLTVLNRLTMGDRMIGWNVGVNPSCSFCSEPIEIRNHLFFDCDYTKELWTRLTGRLLGPSFTTTWEQILELLVAANKNFHVLFLLRYFFQLCIHTVWRERNARKHGEPSTPLNQLTVFMDKTIRNRISTIRELGDRRYDRCMETWLATR